MNGTINPHPDESFRLQVTFGEEQNQWPPNANAITYELRSLDDGATHEAPALAITTRAMRGNIQAEKDVEGQEEYFSDEAPRLTDLERVIRTTRRTTKVLERENNIL